MAPRASSPRALLCAVLDAGAFGSDPERTAERLFAAGVDWIQIRDRTLESDALFRTASAIVRAAGCVSERRSRDAPTDAAQRVPRVIVNRRVDIALAAGADGVHLGFDAVDVTSARALLGDDALIGRSFHSVEEVDRAAREAPARAPSYAHLAPIWNPSSKPASRQPLGERALRAAAGLGLPVFAQGGVDEARVGAALAAGAAGIAVTGPLQRPAHAVAAAERLRGGLDSAPGPEG